MDAAIRKRQSRTRRRRRIRKKITGTAAVPRLSVYRSNIHIYAQLIDDRAGHTVAAASSLEVGIATPDDTTDGAKVAIARQVGQRIGQRGSAAGVDRCVFDRGGNRYAGRVQALAEAARDAGLTF